MKKLQRCRPMGVATGDIIRVRIRQAATADALSTIATRDVEVIDHNDAYDLDDGRVVRGHLVRLPGSEKVETVPAHAVVEIVQPSPLYPESPEEADAHGMAVINALAPSQDGGE